LPGKSSKGQLLSPICAEKWPFLFAIFTLLSIAKLSFIRSFDRWNFLISEAIDKKREKHLLFLIQIFVISGWVFFIDYKTGNRLFMNSINNQYLQLNKIENESLEGIQQFTLK
jgi:hypothetical protein